MQKTQSVDDVKRLLQNAYNEFASRVRAIAQEYQSLGEPNERAQNIFEETLAKVDAAIQASLARVEAESSPMKIENQLRAREIAKQAGRWR